MLLITYVQNLSSHPWSHTWRMLMIPDWILGRWGHFWHHGSSWYVILDLCAKFQLSSMNRSVSRTPVLEVILGGRWRFLTGDLEDRVILDVLDHLGRHTWTYPESFMKIWLHLGDLWWVEILARTDGWTNRVTYRGGTHLKRIKKLFIVIIKEADIWQQPYKSCVFVNWQFNNATY